MSQTHVPQNPAHLHLQFQLPQFVHAQEHQSNPSVICPNATLCACLLWSVFTRGLMTVEGEESYNIWCYLWLFSKLGVNSQQASDVPAQCSTAESWECCPSQPPEGAHPAATIATCQSHNLTLIPPCSPDWDTTRHPHTVPANCQGHRPGQRWSRVHGGIPQPEPHTSPAYPVCYHTSAFTWWWR